MKKFVAILLALSMVLAFAGCAAADEAPETTAAAPVETTAAPETTVAAETEAAETEAAVTVMTHDEYVAAELDTAVTVETYVQAVESWWDGACHIYAQSEDGGYYIYGYACTQEEADALVPGTKILVNGYKAEWSGEVEIVDATIEILEGSYVVTEAADVTELLGTEELKAHMNSLVAFKGLTVAASTDAEGKEAAYLYKWDGSGSQGDDLYFNVAMGDQVYTFTVNVYMLGTGVDSDVYKTVESLNIGDVIDVEGFLYWYDNAQPHVTSVTVAE